MSGRNAEVGAWRAMPVAERYLDVAAVTKQFGSAVVLKNLDLAVGRNEFVSLLGPSGCGKTTLLRLIAGLMKADSGRISISGNDLTRIAAHKRNIGVVFQNYALFPHLTGRSTQRSRLRTRPWPGRRHQFGPPNVSYWG